MIVLYFEWGSAGSTIHAPYGTEMTGGFGVMRVSPEYTSLSLKENDGAISTYGGTCVALFVKNILPTGQGFCTDTHITHGDICASLPVLGSRHHLGESGLKWTIRFRGGETAIYVKLRAVIAVRRR